MIDLLSQTTLTTQATRPPSLVMDLERLGALNATRLSFARTLMRVMGRQRWQISCDRFDLNESGHGEVIYRVQTPNGRYHVVIFSQPLDDALRSDRVIADAWDITFGLVEGDVEESLMESLAENIPLQEAGRQHPRLLVISRANKSLRNFDNFVNQLASGQQPSPESFTEGGYLYRTTAVYGNGKFGIADYGRLRNNPDFRHPFSAQMTTVYVLRQFSIDQVEFLARARSPDTAITLAKPLKRFLGIGNSTGLGMAPFLVNHPQLIDQWINVREQALAIAKSQTPDEPARERLLSLCQRAMRFFQETSVEDIEQQSRNRVVIDELGGIIDWLEQIPLEVDLWQQITDWAEAALSLESQELINGLLIELYPRHVDFLEDAMAVDERMELVPDMPLVQLKQLIETHFDWALAEDFETPEACHWFWYRSIEKEEPRLGVRGVDPGCEKELSLAVAPRVKRTHGKIADYLDENPRSLTVEFLMAEPTFVDIVRRIQTMAATPFGEIRANLWHRDMRPIHLLRTKLSFLGANRFDPRGERWVRVTFFQGAPLIEELNSEPTDLADFDDWSFPLAPTGSDSQAASESFL